MRYTIQTDDELEHRTAINGARYLGALQSADKLFGDRIKYAQEQGDPDPFTAGVEWAREALREAMADEGVTLWDE